MQFLNYQEAADLLRISLGTLRKKVMLREVPFYKPFGPHSRVLFLREDLESWIAAQRVAPVERDESYV
jgi:excisionase family DNA binding protein